LSSKKHWYSRNKKITKRSDYKGGKTGTLIKTKTELCILPIMMGCYNLTGRNGINIPSNSDVKSVEIDSSGKIYIGSYNEFGYFKGIQKENWITIHYLNSLTKK
jgi:hypothetical protein